MTLCPLGSAPTVNECPLHGLLRATYCHSFMPFAGDFGVENGPAYRVKGPSSVHYNKTVTYMEKIGFRSASFYVRCAAADPELNADELTVCTR